MKLTRAELAMMPRANTYDLLSERWVPCLRLTGQRCAFGLIETLRQAHQLREIRDPSPVVTYGLYRLLLAIVQERLDPQTVADWIAVYRGGQFPPELIEASRVQDGDRFDLFHPEYPFYQSGDLPLAATPEARKTLNISTVGCLRDEVPTATYVNHFRHAYDDRQAYCPSCAAGGLVALAPFAYSGGRPYTPSINGDPPIYTWLVGSNLFETLAWNLALSAYQPKAAAGLGQPSWRGDGTIRSQDHRDRVDYLESLTWRPRRLRLLPGAGGCCTFCGRESPILVRELIRDQGWSRPKDAPWWQDPFVAYGVGGRDRPRALRPQEDRVLWRDYANLFLPAVESGRRHPARIVAQAADLAERLNAGGALPALQCYALRNDKAKVFEWACETLPFSPRMSTDLARSTTLERSLGTAEEIAGVLKGALKLLYPRGGKGNPKAFLGLIRQAQEAYWSGLAEPFRRLVLELDDPASDPDVIEDGWHETIDGVARGAFETIAGSFDADADALRRVAQARRSFYGGLKKRLP